jgi:tetratricopeptide (TPR) repeat protein
MPRALAALVVVPFLVMTAPVLAQHDHAPAGDPPEQLGTVHFETSCAPAVRGPFNRAVALLHSFWFSAAIDGFEKVLAEDPRCAMAHWGIALARWGNPFSPIRSTKQLEAGRAAIEAARAAAPPTERERLYVAAAARLFHDHASVDQRTRIVAYERAMEELSGRFADDPEAATFYALSLAQSALPTDKTYANLLKSATILEALFEDQPDHPGLAHYIIHSYDVPPLAPRALEAARRYAKIAPSAPHALHMPSHTFTRLGYWEESIATNEESARAARRDGAVSEELHALDYQTYAYLQTAQDAAARKVLAQLPALGARLDVESAGSAAPGPAGLFALAAIPARHALERGDWHEAAGLPVRRTSFRWTDAVTHFARALGAARSGRPDQATDDLAALAAIRDEFEQKREAYWSEQAAIQHLAAGGWIEMARGHRDEGLRLLREAARLEEQTEKSAITPGPIAPARELLAEALLEAKEFAAARAEFEAVLTTEPRRFRSTYGAAQAALLGGDTAGARRHFEQLAAICERGDEPGREALRRAREYLGTVRSAR